MAQVVRGAVVMPLCQWRHFLSPQTTAPHRLSFVTSPSRRRHAHFLSRGLRLPRESEPGETSRSSGEASLTEENKERSRNLMKREARQAVRWGMDLASFSTPQIKRILKAAALEREVLEALMLVKKLGPDVREGKRRQYNYIGKLLRGAQPDLLGALIQATKDGDQSRFQALAGSMESTDEDAEEEIHECESEQELGDSSEHLFLANKWHEGLINKDIKISNEVYSVEGVEFDRQELRRLVRKVHSLQDGTEDNKMAAKKSLKLFLCSLAKRQLLSTANCVTNIHFS